MTCLSSGLASHTGSALPCPVRIMNLSTMPGFLDSCAYMRSVSPALAVAARLLEHSAILSVADSRSVARQGQQPR